MSKVAKDSQRGQDFKKLIAAAGVVSALLLAYGCARIYRKVFATNLPTARVTIATPTGPQEFNVQIAATPASQEQGLMFRPWLGKRDGMYFNLRPGVHMVSMWMKNTSISLDMIFVGGDSRVRNVAENTVPESLALIPSAGPVEGVLEVRAGTVKQLGIGTGDPVVVVRRRHQ